MKPTLIILLIAYPMLARSQSEKLDSLYHLLKNHPEEDTTRVNILIESCFYELTSDPEKSKLHAEEAKRIAEEIKYPRGIGLSLRYLSNYHSTKGDFEKAIEFGLAMLKNFEAINNTDGLVRSYQLLGGIHARWNNFDKSKEYLTKALELSLRANMDKLYL